jgi:hypothetical protein
MTRTNQRKSQPQPERAIISLRGVGLAVLGGLITVQPWLIASAVLFALLGLVSFPGARRRGDPALEAGKAARP